MSSVIRRGIGMNDRIAKLRDKVSQPNLPFPLKGRFW